MFLKRSEFADAVGVTLNTLKQHVRRKKIFISEGGYVDTDFELNKIYIEKQTNGEGLDLTKIKNKEANQKNTQPETKKPPAQIKESVVKETLPSPPISNSENNELSISEVIKQKQRADLLKVEKEIELKQIDIEKKMGRLMPIDMVETILTINIQTILRTFESECENVISICVERLGGDRSDIADLGKRMRESLFKSIQNVESKSKDEIEAVIKEYAVVRSRGERK